MKDLIGDNLKVDNIFLDKIKKSFQDILETMQEIAENAYSNKNDKFDTSVLINYNPMLDGSNIKKRYSNQTNYSTFEMEPFHARVEVLCNGQKEVYYINYKESLSSLKSSSKIYLHYKAELGKLATHYEKDCLKIGDNYYEIISSIIINPIYYKQWDAQPARYLKYSGHILYSSIRTYLNSLFIPKQTDFDLEHFLMDTDEETKKVRILSSIRKKVILKQQPILDKMQDKVFRLPIDSFIMLQGRPGTGKTTTLIKRISQKTDTNFLSDEEKSIIQGTVDHKNSWIMFTPNDLLKSYLKEAFNKENIPASNEKIKTWDELSFILARDVIGLLKREERLSSLTFVKNKNIINQDSNFRDFYLDYEKYYLKKYLNEINTSLEWAEDNLKNQLFVELKKLLIQIDDYLLESLKLFLIKLVEKSDQIKEIFAYVKSEVEEEKIINDKLKEIIEKDKKFLEELYNFSSNIKKSPSNDNNDEEEQEVEITGEDKNIRKQAKDFYQNAIFTLARSKIKGKIINPKSEVGKILEYLGDRIPDQNYILDIGRKITINSHKTILVNSPNRILNSVSKSYLNYRRKGNENGFYTNIPDTTEIDQFELDILILLKLKLIHFYNENLDSSKRSLYPLLSEFENYLKNQVLIDEVTDFSPIQIKCIKLLANPKIKSIFVSGDFNQRLTKYGLKDHEDISWGDEVKYEEITNYYRQSSILYDFSNKLVNKSDNQITPVNNEKEFKPVLGEKLSNYSLVTSWLSDRIIEIKNNLGMVPSIAILVNNDFQVDELKEKLEEEINGKENFRIFGSKGGRDIADDHDIRIYSIQYIKGLEFESVFFIDVDDLKENHPDLYNKYLYVGSTRAATFLGFTCKIKLPLELEQLREYFCERWE